MDPTKPECTTTTTPTTPPPPTLRRRLAAIDAALSSALHSHNFLPRSVFILLELSADFRLFFPLSLFLLLFLPLSVLSPLLFGLLLDLPLIGITKTVFRRSRPSYNKNMSVVVSVDHFSFPSGHSSRVFFVATFVLLSKSLIEVEILRLSGDFVKKWIGEGKDEILIDFVVLGVGSWAFVTAVSRVLLGRHFVFDVFVGACLGVMEGLFAFHYLRLL